jgi:hypothetical protein
MADAEIRLIGISRQPPARPGEEDSGPTLDLAVGKSDRLRRVPLTEKKLIDLITQASNQLDILRERRVRKEQRER